MAKIGLKIENVKKILDKNEKWSICVGAGINKGLMPDWYELIDRLINKCAGADRINIEKFKGLGFSADAMLQAIKNYSKMSDDDFLRELSSLLYEKIDNKLSDEEMEFFLNLLDRNTASKIYNHEEIVTRIVEKCFLNLTANQIAESITSSIIGGNLPYEILTFNGDDILYFLLCYHYYMKTKDAKNHFKNLVNSLSGFEKDITYVVHCHGVIPHNKMKLYTGQIANDKLIFSEESYLQLANNTTSFQANHFISASMNSSIVFIGVSLTDSNMRKWLSWTHKLKVDDLRENNISSETATEHYWINKKQDNVTMKWIEESVSHLGIRLIWINEWNEVGEVLRKILGVKESTKKVRKKKKYR